MKFTHITKSKFKEQSGVTAVFVAIIIPILLGVAALAIDIGYLYATKNELQNIADAAALAGAGKLGEIYSDPTIDPATYYCTSDDINLIESSAQGVIGQGKNVAGAKNITIRTEDILINTYPIPHPDPPDPDDRTTFESDYLNQPNAVRVVARRDSILNTSVGTFFAKIFNIDTIPIQADATAALTGLGMRPEGGLPIPIGVSVDMFTGNFCNQPLVFNPTTSSCAGWHTYDTTIPIKQIVEGLVDGTFTSPETLTGDIYDFNGGTNDATYKVLYTLFEIMKKLDDDGDDTTWTTTIPVFDGPCYTNPNQPYPIVGFAEIKIYGICHSQTAGQIYNGELCLAAQEHVVGDLVCDLILPSRGGGAEAGIMGTIPGLVE